MGRWFKLAMLAVSLAILTFLVAQARREPALADLSAQTKDFRFLVWAWLCSMAALGISFARWFLLVRALELEFRLLDAFRLGFLGYLFNFISPGNVGGDLFKAVFIAQEQPGRRAEAVATVVVDRVIGLYGLFLVASGCIVYSRLWHSGDAQIVLLSQATLCATAAGGIAVMMMLVPGFTQGALSEALTGLPRVGHTIGQLIGAVRMYRRRFPVLVVAVLLSLAVHLLVTLGLYFVARALPALVWPAAIDHFIIVPLAMVAGAIPLLPMGLGAFEGAMDFLYVQASSVPGVAAGQGLLVAFVYRLFTILLAALGVPFWLTSRRQVAQAMRAVDDPKQQ